MTAAAPGSMVAGASVPGSLSIEAGESAAMAWAQSDARRIWRMGFMRG
jgi:hypothetical protein